METKQENNKLNQSESEEDLDDTELLDDKPKEEEQISINQPILKAKTPNINIEKILELRKKFRDKEFLVKGLEFIKILISSNSSSR